MELVSVHGRALNVGGGGPTRLMGIVNVTPDSFSDGGRFVDADAGVAHGLSLVEAGADILDVGGESTRPGYDRVPAATQIERVVPVIQELRERCNTVISIDTTSAAVAEAALEAGADWVNDTTAFREDPELGRLVARAGCPVVLMHRFDPAREEADERTVRGLAMVEQLADNLQERLDHANELGIERNRILLDPGMGFGTTLLDNAGILAHVAKLFELGCPLLVGPSRKSFLGHITGKPVEDREFGTAAAVAALALAGVEVIRVHDVAAMKDVIEVADAIRAEAV